jgi:DIS3-like exonuclease 1
LIYFRYADVIVHRLLLSALKDQDWWSDTDEKQKIVHMTNTQLSELCEHINERNKAAQLAQRQSQLLFQTLFFRNKEPDDPRCIVEAVISRIRSNGFLVYVPCYALKGPVYLQVNLIIPLKIYNHYLRILNIIYEAGSYTTKIYIYNGTPIF